MQSVAQVMNQVVPNMTLVNEGVCEHCKNEIKVYETEIIGGPNKGEKTEITYGCKCEDIQMANKALEAKKDLVSKQIKEKFNQYSLINKKLINATLEGFEPQNNSQDYAKKTIVRYIDIFDKDDPRNLALSGGFGVGKSHLAKAVTDGVIERGYSAIFISVPKLLRRIRSTYNSDSEINEDDIFHMLETVDLLVLDERGAEKQSEWAEEKVFDVIDSRQGMHTIYTVNYSPKDLFDILGERNFSRVVNEDTTIVEIEGDNYRLRDMNEG